VDAFMREKNEIVDFNDLDYLEEVGRLAMKC
jgi:hypothetical protein